MRIGIIAFGFIYLLWMVSRRKKYRLQPLKEFLLNGFVFYLLSVVFLTMQPFQWNLPFGISGGKSGYHFDYRLFYELSHMSDLQLQTLYSVGNIALFFPLGIFLPILFRSCRRFGVLLFISFCGSLTIELTQTFFTMTRRGTLDDLVFNTAGAVLGYSLYALFHWFGKKVSLFLVANNR